ncbi:MAG: putative molybdenum carrier protein [Proteobacteria bacterium]|nr:putative molybdenum carrier protein [Pseudomonadota bacterium]
MNTKIVSGGQTGADIAALDVAIKLNIPHGGWIPKGRKTEAGPLPDRYQLQEMPTGSYTRRTEQNVIDSDGTLVFMHSILSGGSLKTYNYAKKYNKPCLHLDMTKLSVDEAVKEMLQWIEKNNLQILNVAGPRGSKDPEIYTVVKEVLTIALTENLADK